VETTKYPADQSVDICLPQYGKVYFDFKYEQDLAFNAPITFPSVSCGVNSNKKCIWSASPFISKIFIDILFAIIGSVVIKSWIIL